MTIKLVIITPCSRIENLFVLEKAIKSIPETNRRWIVVFDREEIPLDIPKSCEPYAFKDKESVFGNAQRNYAFQLIDEGYIYFNDDDTVIHPHLWDNIKNSTEDFVYFKQEDKEGKIRLEGEIVAPNYIDSGNFIVTRQCIGDIRWDLKRYDADGVFAQECYKKAKTKKYIPISLSIYNSLK